ncbi:MAG: PAS domain-containing protein, partial [SAR324 cluster bacterium]|nr:PAS domain-containing protein [SAR324 cluster bacterium]
HSSPDLILSIDRELKIEGYNHQPALYPERCVVGASILDWIPAEQAEKAKACLGSVIETGEIGKFQFIKQSPFGKELHFESTASARYNGNQIIGLLARITDITEQKLAADQLIKIKERLEIVVATSGIGVWDWNIKTSEVVFDQGWCKMIGYDQEEIPQELSSWETRVHPDDLENCLIDIKAHLAGETRIYRNIHRLKHQDGQWLYILDVGKVVEWDSEGEPLRFVGTHTDISKEQELTEQLSRANKTKDKFFSIISHDLRSPFNGILGGIDLIKGEINGDKNHPFFDLVEMVSLSAKRAFNLLDDLLTWSRLQSEHLKAEIEPILAKDIIASSLERNQAVAALKEVKIESQIPKTLILFADKKMLQEILSNLISNSIKFSPRGAKVSIKCTEDEEFNYISVKDQGAGVALTDQAKLFNVGELVSAPGTEGEQGTGLGLGLVQEFMDAMDGSIHYDQSYQDGANFILTLPKPEI